MVTSESTNPWENPAITSEGALELARYCLAGLYDRGNPEDYRKFFAATYNCPLPEGIIERRFYAVSSYLGLLSTEVVNPEADPEGHEEIVGFGYSLLGNVATELKLQRLKEEIAKKDIDGLTKLPRREAFERQVRKLFENGRSSDFVEVGSEQSRPMLAWFGDGDRFKHVNDEYGHSVGDGVIAGIGSLFNSTLREGDLRQRYGGDEFAGLFLGKTEKKARQVFNRLRNAANKGVKVNIQEQNKTLQVTVSVAGVYCPDVTSAEMALKLIDAADALLIKYKAWKKRKEVEGVVGPDPPQILKVESELDLDKLINS